MPVMVLLASLLLFFLICLTRQRCAFREAYLYALIALGLCVAVATEALSFFNALSFWWVLGLWALICVGSLVWFYLHNLGVLPDQACRWVSSVNQLKNDEKFYVAYLVVLLLCTGTIAWIAPPNTFDSMTYHMSRVMHWRQNETVAFYPTSILRQLFSAPWAEYAILHTMILSGTDRFANFVQWFCMLSSLIVVSGVAKELGANRRGQLLASVVCATIPMGILQSTSTQNDYVVSLWVLCVAWLALRLYKNFTLGDAAFLGAALGLAILTKPTAYLFTFPFFLLLVCTFLYRVRIKKIVGLSIICLMALTINAGHFYRNYEFSGTPLGQTLETGYYSYENSAFSPSIAASNVLRNLGLHLESRSSFDRIVQRGIEVTHDYLGISIGDKRTTWPEYEFRVQGLKHHEDYAGNLWHTLLIFGSLAIYCLFLPKMRIVIAYTFALVASGIIFCALLRWQPWHSRLHLPLFVLWAPFIGLILGQIEKLRIKDIISIRSRFLTGRMRWLSRMLVWTQQMPITYLVGLLLIYASWWSIGLSETKPLLGPDSIFKKEREAQLFSGAPNLAKAYFEVATSISQSNCTKIGLFGFSNDWEYPFWVLVKPAQQSTLEVRHVTASATSPTGKPLKKNTVNLEFEPCAIIAPANVPHEEIKTSKRIYRAVVVSDSIKLYQ